jgi:hypothetical protein
MFHTVIAEEPATKLQSNFALERTQCILVRAERWIASRRSQ